MKKSITLFLLLVCFAPIHAGDPPETADAERIMERIGRMAGDVQTISSDFSQEKHLSMLKNVTVTKGAFYFAKPDRLRWEFTHPDRAGFAVDGDKGIKWKGKEENRRPFQLGSDPAILHFVNQVFAWVRADRKWLKEHYRISVRSEEPAAFSLFPVTEQEKNVLSRVEILFSSDDRYVQQVEIHERDGDFTRIHFLNTIINLPFKPELFQ